MNKKAQNTAKRKVTALFVSAIALVLVAAVVIISVLGGGGAVTDSGNLMKGIHGGRKTAKITDDFKKQYSDFCSTIIADCAASNENAAFSLTNVMSAVSLMAYSAESDNRNAAEQLLGGDCVKTAKQLGGIEKRIATKSDKSGMHLSNTLWINDAKLYPVKKSFLKANKEYFGLGVNRVTFTDKETVNSVLTTVSDATHGSTYPTFSINLTKYMSIVSGASFMSQWAEPVAEDEQSVFDGIFATADGEFTTKYFKTVAEKQLSGETFSGVAKAYDSDYTFVALLPNNTDGELQNSVSDVVKELKEKNKLSDLLSLAKEKRVAISLPYYTNSISAPTTTDLTEVIKNNTSKNLFGDAAGLKGISDINGLRYEYIVAAGDISLTPAGTGVSAAVDSDYAKAEVLDECKTHISFDRSFIYFVVDNESGLPVYFALINRF